METGTLRQKLKNRSARVKFDCHEKGSASRLARATGSSQLDLNFEIGNKVP
jgi:hypothetical protein